MQRNFLKHVQKREYTGRFLYNKNKKDIDLEAKKIITEMELMAPLPLEKEREYYQQIIKLAGLGSKAALDYIKQPDAKLFENEQFSLLVDAYYTLALMRDGAFFLIRLFEWFATFQGGHINSDSHRALPNFNKAIAYLEQAAVMESKDAIPAAYKLVFLYACEIGGILSWEKYRGYGFISGYFDSFVSDAKALLERKSLLPHEYIELITSYAEHGSYHAIRYLCSMYRDGLALCEVLPDKDKAAYWEKKEKENGVLLRKRCLHSLDRALACSMKYGNSELFCKQANGYSTDVMPLTISMNTLLDIYFSLTESKDEAKLDFIDSCISQCKRYIKQGYAYSENFLVLMELINRSEKEKGNALSERAIIDLFPEIIKLRIFNLTGIVAFEMIAKCREMLVGFLELNKGVADIDLLKFAAQYGSADAAKKIIALAIKEQDFEKADQWLEFGSEHLHYFKDEYYPMAESLNTLEDKADKNILTQYYIKWLACSMLRGCKKSAGKLQEIAKGLDLKSLTDECETLSQEIEKITHTELYKDKVEAFANKLIDSVCNQNLLQLNHSKKL